MDYNNHEMIMIYHTVKPRPEAHMGMIPPEVLLRNIHLIPQDQTVQWHYLYYKLVPL